MIDKSTRPAYLQIYEQFKDDIIRGINRVRRKKRREATDPE